MVYFFDGSIESYKLYFASRFADFPSTRHANTSNRLELLLRLFSELLLPIGIIAIVVLVNYCFKNNSPYKTRDTNKSLLFFLLVGLSASLPLMVTFEQRGFYLNTSLPFFALSLAALSSERLTEFENGLALKFKSKIGLKILLNSIIIAGIGFTLWQMGKPKRDVEKLSDLKIISRLVKNGSTICTTSNNWNDWSLHNYFQRFYQISLKDSPTDCNYFICTKEESKTQKPNYKQIELGTLYYNIYSKVK